jgi:hypothetical protein
MDEAIARLDADIHARRDSLLDHVHTTPDEIL